MTYATAGIDLDVKQANLERIVGLHLYAIPGRGKFTEEESRAEAISLGSRRALVMFNTYRIYVGDNEGIISIQ